MSIFKKRIKSLASHLTKTGVAIISGNPRVIRSNDTHFPSYRNSELLYFTGTDNQEVALVVSGTGQSWIVALKSDEERALWDGLGESPKVIAKRIGAKLIPSESIMTEVKKLIEGHEALYYQVVEGSISQKIASFVFSQPFFKRRNLPKQLAPLETVSSKLRLIKTAEEIRSLEEAVAITASSFFEAVRFLNPGVSEKFIGSTLEYWISAQGGDTSFSTIVASGGNASILHHTPTNRQLKKGEFVLLDFGGSMNGYCADVSRTVPVGMISQRLVDLYHIVLESQEAAISTVKPGKLLSDVHLEAAKIMIKGLMALKLLKRGSVASHLKDKSYKKFFPHSIGHSLGLDVHDIGPLRESAENELKEGMVITIEPGIYMKGVCGIRIEDDVLVTKRGHRNLTEAIPKDINILAALARGEIEVG